MIASLKLLILGLRRPAGNVIQRAGIGGGTQRLFLQHLSEPPQMGQGAVEDANYPELPTPLHGPTRRPTTPRNALSFA